LVTFLIRVFSHPTIDTNLEIFQEVISMVSNPKHPFLHHIGNVLGAVVLIVSLIGCGPVMLPNATPTVLAPTVTATLLPLPTATATTDPAVYTSPVASASIAPILDPLTIPKFVVPLVIPPVMPSEGRNGQGQVATTYRIAVRQFSQQVLPAGFPKTIVWGYGHLGDPLPDSGLPSTFNYPSFTIEARTNELVRVEWVNQLVDNPYSANPKFLPALLPIDQTLHWANPTGLRDTEGTSSVTYTGPMPMITHVHGAHVQPVSDGFPEAWYLPVASNIPAGASTQGSYYGSVYPTQAGAAVFEYPNDQRATTLWYHDHSLGLTRTNVYSGEAGFWLLRDETETALNLPGPAPRLGDAAGTQYFEIPIVIQDRSFRTDGSLFYPDSRTYFDGYAGPYKPDTTVNPIWNPEFFGNTIVVNGKTWPYLEVEPRLYRFRLLDGAQARSLILKFDKPLSFTQIGNEGGLLPDKPIVLDQLLMGPAERADVIVDFSQFKVGDTITLLNVGPDSPLQTLPVDPTTISNPDTTGQVMQFRVVAPTSQGNQGTIPATLPSIPALTTNLRPRDLTLNEESFMPLDIPVEAVLGTAADGPLMWGSEITEKPVLYSTEIWRIINLTADAHPINLHQVHFQVLDRTPFDAEAYKTAQQAYISNGKIGTPPDPLTFATGAAVQPNSWEAGWKETVLVYPDMFTRLITRFDIAGLYVWHCHILEHEDNEMMRPFLVVPGP
jgi:spore coat protein A